MLLLSHHYHHIIMITIVSVTLQKVRWHWYLLQREKEGHKGVQREKLVLFKQKAFIQQRGEMEEEEKKGRKLFDKKVMWCAMCHACVKKYSPEEEKRTTKIRISNFFRAQKCILNVKCISPSLISFRFLCINNSANNKAFGWRLEEWGVCGNWNYFFSSRSLHNTVFVTVCVV